MLPDSVIESLLASFSPDSTPKRPTALRSTAGGNDVFTAFLQRARARFSDRPAAAALSDTTPTSDAAATPRLVTSGAFNPVFAAVKQPSASAVSDASVNKNGLLSGPAEQSVAAASAQAVDAANQHSPADAELEQILALLPRVVAELFGLDPAAQNEILQSFAAAVSSDEGGNVQPETATEAQAQWTTELSDAPADVKQIIKQAVKLSANAGPVQDGQTSAVGAAQAVRQPVPAAGDPAPVQALPVETSVAAPVQSTNNVNTADNAESAANDALAASRNIRLTNPEKAAFVNRAVASDKSLNPSEVAAPQVENQPQNNAREVMQPQQASGKQSRDQSTESASGQPFSGQNNPPAAAQNVNKESVVTTAAIVHESAPDTTIFKVEFVGGRARIEAPGLNAQLDSAPRPVVDVASATLPVENSAAQPSAAVRTAQTPAHGSTPLDVASDRADRQVPVGARQVDRGQAAESAQPDPAAKNAAPDAGESARPKVQPAVPHRAEIVLDAPLRDGHREILPRTLHIELDGNSQSSAASRADAAPARAANALLRLTSLLGAVRELGGDIQSIRITTAPAEAAHGKPSGLQSGYFQPPALSAEVIQALRDIAAGRTAPLHTVSPDSGTPLAAASIAETKVSGAPGAAVRESAPKQSAPPEMRAGTRSVDATTATPGLDAALNAARPVPEKSIANGVETRVAAPVTVKTPPEAEVKPVAAHKVATGEAQAESGTPKVAAPQSRGISADVKNVEPTLLQTAALKQDRVGLPAAAEPTVGPAPDLTGESTTESANKTAAKPAAEQIVSARPAGQTVENRAGEQSAPRAAVTRPNIKSGESHAAPAQVAPQQATEDAEAGIGRAPQPKDAQPWNREAAAMDKSSTQSGLNRRVETQAAQPHVHQPGDEPAAQPQAVKQNVAPAPQPRVQSGEAQASAKAETVSPVEVKSATAAPQALQPEVREPNAPRVGAQPQESVAAEFATEGGKTQAPVATPANAPHASTLNAEPADVNNAPAREGKTAVQSQSTNGAVFVENANQNQNDGEQRQALNREVAAPQSTSVKSIKSAQPQISEQPGEQSSRQVRSDKSVANGTVAAPTDEQSSVKHGAQREVLQPTNLKSQNRTAPVVQPQVQDTSAAAPQVQTDNATPQRENPSQVNSGPRQNASSASADAQSVASVKQSQSGQNTQPALESAPQQHTNVKAALQADQPVQAAQNLNETSRTEAAPTSARFAAPAESVTSAATVTQMATKVKAAETQAETPGVQTKQPAAPTPQTAQQQSVKLDSENVNRPASGRVASGQENVNITPQTARTAATNVLAAAGETQVNKAQTASQSAGVQNDVGTMRAVTAENTATDVAPVRTENPATKSSPTPDPLTSDAVVNKKVMPETASAREVVRPEVTEQSAQKPAHEVKNAGAEYRPKPAVTQADDALKQTAQPKQATKNAGDVLNKSDKAQAADAEVKTPRTAEQEQPRPTMRQEKTDVNPRRAAALDIAAAVFEKSAKTMADPTGSTEMMRRAAAQLRQAQTPVRPAVTPVKIEAPRVERLPLTPSADNADVQVANLPLKQPSVNAAEQASAPLFNNGLGAETLAMFAQSAAEEQRPAQEQAQQQVQERRAEQNKVQQQNVAPRAAEEAAARELRPRTVVHEKSFNDPAVPRVSDQSALDGEEQNGDGSGKQSGNYTGEQKGEQSENRATQQADVQATAQQTFNNGAPQRFDEVLREQAQARRSFAPAATAAEGRTVNGATAERAASGRERVITTLRRVAVHRWADTTFGVLRTLPAGRGAAIAMTLNPENLGSVMVELTVNKGVASIKIQTERAETRRILEQHAVALKDKLVQSGMSVDNLEINVRDGELREDARGELAGDRRRNEREEQSARQEFVDSFRFLREEEAALPRPAERVPAAAAADGFERYA